MLKLGDQLFTVKEDVKLYRPILTIDDDFFTLKNIPGKYRVDTWEGIGSFARWYKVYKSEEEYVTVHERKDLADALRLEIDKIRYAWIPPQHLDNDKLRVLINMLRGI